MPTVNYLRIVGCKHYAGKRTERNEGFGKDRRDRRSLRRPTPPTYILIM